MPNANHPYGAKGAAEVNICPPMAAIANAIERAVGTRMTELPMSPPKVRAALDAKRKTWRKGRGAARRAAARTAGGTAGLQDPMRHARGGCASDSRCNHRAQGGWCAGD